MEKPYVNKAMKGDKSAGLATKHSMPGSGSGATADIQAGRSSSHAKTPMKKDQSRLRPETYAKRNFD